MVKIEPKKKNLDATLSPKKDLMQLDELCYNYTPGIDQNREFKITRMETQGCRSSPRVGALGWREVEAVAVLATAEPRRVGPRETALHHGGHVLC